MLAYVVTAAKGTVLSSHRLTELASGDGEVSWQDDKLLHLLRVGDGLGVVALDALPDGLIHGGLLAGDHLRHGGGAQAAVPAEADDFGAQPLRGFAVLVCHALGEGSWSRLCKTRQGRYGRPGQYGRYGRSKPLL